MGVVHVGHSTESCIYTPTDLLTLILRAIKKNIKEIATASLMLYKMFYYECSKFHWRLTSDSKSIAQILCECALHFFILKSDMIVE